MGTISEGKVVFSTLEFLLGFSIRRDYLKNSVETSRSSLTCLLS